jgi:hypothetical protein
MLETYCFFKDKTDFSYLSEQYIRNSEWAIDILFIINMFYECLIYDDLKLFLPLHFGSFIVLVLAAINVLLMLLESRLICITTSHPLQNCVASND